MLTEEEKDEIIAKAVEKTLLAIPEVVGNLMSNHAVLHKLNREFYTKYPEFKDSKDSVASAIEMIEGKNPLMKYEDILKKAVPEIRTRMNTMKSLNTTTVSKTPDRSFKRLDAPSDQHGEI